jgi:hypothetical protein
VFGEIPTALDATPLRHCNAGGVPRILERSVPLVSGLGFLEMIQHSTARSGQMQGPWGAPDEETRGERMSP